MTHPHILTYSIKHQSYYDTGIEGRRHYILSAREYNEAVACSGFQGMVMCFNDTVWCQPLIAQCHWFNNLIYLIIATKLTCKSLELGGIYTRWECQGNNLPINLLPIPVEFHSTLNPWINGLWFSVPLLLPTKLCPLANEQTSIDIIFISNTWFSNNWLFQMTDKGLHAFVC